MRQECLQWVWEPGKCRLGKVVRFGIPVIDGDDKVKHEWNGAKRGVVSGWLGPRIVRMVEGFGSCEDKRKWMGRREFEL